MLRGAGHLAAIALVIHALSWLTLHPSVYAWVHRRQLHLADGYHLASALAAFRSAPSPRVLIIGPSSTRQSFAAETISLAVPPYTVVNAATAGGSLLCHALQLRAAERLDIAPDVLVVGLNAMLLFDERLNVAETGYTDLQDLRDADLLELNVKGDGEEEADIRKQLLVNTLFPAARHRRIAAMHWRMALFDLQATYATKPLDLRVFRRNKYEFQEPWPFPFGYVEPNVQQQEMQRMHWQRIHRLEADMVGQPRHFAQLDRILAGATELAPRVVVVLMPLHSWVREHVEALARQPMLDHLASWSGSRITILDWSELLDDKEFYDYVHPTARGRTRTSLALSDYLRTLPKP